MKHFPVASQVQFFMVILWLKLSDGLLAAGNKVQEKMQALECLFTSAYKSEGHSGKPGGGQLQATNTQARGRIGTKGKAQFLKCQGQVFLKCKLITARGGNDNKHNNN